MIDFQQFNIDDIDVLAIRSKRKNMGLDPTDQYDITYYENYIKENIVILSNFMKDTLNSINSIKDEKIKQRLTRWVNHDLVPLYEKNLNKKVREDAGKYPNPNVGYYESHKYALFIERDMIDFISDYDKLINFMNNVYTHYKICEKKAVPDKNVLYEIFANSKNACSNLGIHSVDSEELYNAISFPYEEHSRLCDVDVEEVEENYIENDILISSLPYSVSLPSFTTTGPRKYESRIVDMPKVFYNKSYLEKTQTR